MTSEHHDAKPATLDEVRFENTRLREQLDDARHEAAGLREQLDAARRTVVPLKTGVDQLTAAVRPGSDHRHRNEIAATWVRELLAMPSTRPGSHEAMHIDGLRDELQGILDALTASGGDVA